MRRRSLTDQDRLAWARYVQNVERLAHVGAIAAPAAPAEAAPLADEAPRVPPTVSPRHALAALEIGLSPGGVDRSTWSRFRSGKLAVERTLDLHGRTLDRAHRDLTAFLLAAAASGLRCVEVITGRGSGEGGGVIRREFTHWLNSPALRPLVLAAAHPHPANPGSVRLLLRRIR